MMNGDISRSPSQSGTLEETLQQMNILIQENRDLKGERRRCVVVGSEPNESVVHLSFLLCCCCTTKKSVPVLILLSANVPRVKGWWMLCS